MKKFLKSNLEVLIWTSAIMYLALIDPSTHQQISICPLHNLGFEHCPGCGLGRSVSFLLHGNVSASFTMHLLGIPALLIILHRIVTLLFKMRNSSTAHNAVHLNEEPSCQT